MIVLSFVPATAEIDFIKVSDDRKEMKKLVKEDPNFKRMSMEAFRVVAEYASITGKLNVDKIEQQGGEEMGVNMCKGIADWLEEEKELGVAQGMAQGIAKGEILGVIKTAREYGATDLEILAKLVNQYHLSEDEAKRICEEIQ